MGCGQPQRQKPRTWQFWLIASGKWESGSGSVGECQLGSCTVYRRPDTADSGFMVRRRDAATYKPCNAGRFCSAHQEWETWQKVLTSIQRLNVVVPLL